MNTKPLDRQITLNSFGQTGTDDIETGVSISAGRVSTLNLGLDGSVKILTGPEFGTLSVNPDNTLALVLHDPKAVGEISFSVEITAVDGTTRIFAHTLAVTPSVQEKGWGEGNSYMLAVDDTDHVIVETGDNHRKVYIGGSDAALSKSDVARIEGIDASKITVSWLRDHPEYGGSEDMALDADLGMDLWYSLTYSPTQGPNSHWLMFERGHSYDDLGRFVQRGATGESELHPMHVTSWGQGDRPVIDSEIKLYQEDSRNIVFTDVTISGGTKILAGGNLLFDDVRFEDKMAGIQYADNVTIRNSEMVDIYMDAPNGNAGKWQAHFDRDSAIFTKDMDGLLMEGNFIHHNGWADGYDPKGSIEGGQPPSMFSHNVYLQYDTTDVTFRDNIVSQGASFGAQMRGGAFVEDNAFIDNNVGFSVLGGAYGNHGPVSNFSLVNGNVVTSAGYKDAYQIGGLSIGAINKGLMTTLVDNIVAHLADPDDAAEVARKLQNHGAVNNEADPFFDDTIIYDWSGNGWSKKSGKVDENVDGLDAAILDDATIQNFAAEVLGREGVTIVDLLNHIGSLAGTEFDDTFTADMINHWFQTRFGIETVPARDAGQTLRFVPNDLGEGFRWDNRLNWTTDDLPKSGDSIDLGGNRVNFSGTIKIDDLDFGPGGSLGIKQGKLSVDGNIEGIGANVRIAEAGQFWINGHDNGDILDIEISGGRFVNTGTVEGGLDISVSGNGQAILASGGGTFVAASGDQVVISGSRARVGADGTDGPALIQFRDGSVLNFVADAKGISKLGEFRSGTFGDAGSNLAIDLDGAAISINLSAFDFQSGASKSFTLISADALVGSFATDDISVIGLPKDRDITFSLDWDNDVLVAELTNAGQGSGQITVETIGVELVEGDFLATAIVELRSDDFRDMPPVDPKPQPEFPVENGQGGGSVQPLQVAHNAGATPWKIGPDGLTVLAKNFDDGGQGVSYNDDAGLAGGRNGGRDMSDVELTKAGDVGWIEDGEWLEYTIEILKDGVYDLDLMMATKFGGKSASVEFYHTMSDVPYTSRDGIENPSTGGYKNFESRPVEGIELEAGIQVMRVKFGGSQQDFKSFTLTSGEEPDLQADETIGQSGSVQVTQTGPDVWFSVAFDEALYDPSVVMGPVTYNGGDAAITRVRNVTSTGFEFQLDEWNYNDGNHVAETISWLALEAGEHRIGGQTVLAGSSSAAGHDTTFSFDVDFFGKGVPTVLAQVTSVNDPTAVTAQIGAVSSTGFVFDLDREEAIRSPHGSETVSWIAIQNGGQASDGMVSGVLRGVDHRGARADFGSSFDGTDDFVFLADMQSEFGSDTADLRLTGLTREHANVFVEEETSLDTETWHKGEDIGFVAIKAGLIHEDFLFA